MSVGAQAISMFWAPNSASFAAPKIWRRRPGSMRRRHGKFSGEENALFGSLGHRARVGRALPIGWSARCCAPVEPVTYPPRARPSSHSESSARVDRERLAPRLLVGNRSLAHGGFWIETKKNHGTDSILCPSFV